MWLGVAIGLVNGIAQATYPWVGEGAVANLGEAMSGAIGAGLLARGACWIWLRRKS